MTKAGPRLPPVRELMPGPEVGAEKLESDLLVKEANPSLFPEKGCHFLCFADFEQVFSFRK